MKVARIGRVLIRKQDMDIPLTRGILNYSRKTTLPKSMLQKTKVVKKKSSKKK